MFIIFVIYHQTHLIPRKILQVFEYSLKIWKDKIIRKLSKIIINMFFLQISLHFIRGPHTLKVSATNSNFLIPISLKSDGITV